MMWLCTRLTHEPSDSLCGVLGPSLGKMPKTRSHPTIHHHQPPQTMASADGEPRSGSKHLTPPDGDPNNPLLRAAEARRKKELKKKERELKKMQRELKKEELKKEEVKEEELKEEELKEEENKRADTGSNVIKPHKSFSHAMDDLCAELFSVSLGADEDKSLKAEIPGVDDIDSALRHAWKAKQARLKEQGAVSEVPKCRLSRTRVAPNGKIIDLYPSSDQHPLDAAMCDTDAVDHSSVKDEGSEVTTTTTGDDLCAGLFSVSLGADEDKSLKTEIPGVDDIDSAFSHAWKAKLARLEEQGTVSEVAPVPKCRRRRTSDLYPANDEYSLEAAVYDTDAVDHPSVKDEGSKVTTTTAGNGTTKSQITVDSNMSKVFSDDKTKLLAEADHAETAADGDTGDEYVSVL
jgi:hypothetical protein